LAQDLLNLHLLYAPIIFVALIDGNAAAGFSSLHRHYVRMLGECYALVFVQQIANGQGAAQACAKLG